MREKPAIKISGISKCFGETDALSSITASIPAGKITGLVGPDGAGKTTLIRLIAGLMLPTQGSINVNGFDSVKQAEPIHDILGYMPQKFGLYEDLSVMENLDLYARLKNVGKEERKTSFARMLSFTALEPFTTRLAGQLSGGMKQKLGLACALLGTPQLLLLDEPSVGVDPISRRELWKMVKELVDGGMSVIWSTAYLDEAENCDEVLLLNQGKLLFNGAPAELTQRIEGRSYRFPTTLEDRRPALMALLQSDAVIDATIQGKAVRVVLAKDAHPDDTGYALEPVKSRFEDAFIDILGGGPGGESALAQSFDVTAEDAIPIQAQHLTKRFGTFEAAKNISFEVKRGEIFGLLGPNGAGKSTCFKMLCGLLQPSLGTALVLELDLKTSSSLARTHIGYMAQKFSLYGDLNVRQNLEFFAGVYGLSDKTRETAVAHMVTIFELAPYLKSVAGTLPLGFKQRLALACAVMHAPSVLFLDEPTSGVDPLTRREFWMHINSLAQKGVTVMVTTHFMDEAEYCDRIALIYQGQNIATGTPDALKDSVASVPLPDPSLEDTFIALVEQWDRDHADKAQAA